MRNHRKRETSTQAYEVHDIVLRLREHDGIGGLRHEWRFAPGMVVAHRQAGGEGRTEPVCQRSLQSWWEAPARPHFLMTWGYGVDRWFRRRVFGRCCCC